MNLEAIWVLVWAALDNPTSIVDVAAAIVILGIGIYIIAKIAAWLIVIIGGALKASRRF